MEHPGERELVARILAGDETAFRELYLAHNHRIYKGCVYILGYQDPDAEYIAQETFVVARRQLPEFEFRSGLTHWLNRISMYLCWDRIRSRRRQVVSEHEALETLARSRPSDPAGLALESAEKEKLLTLLESERPKLSEGCRGLLDLRDQAGKSYAEVADALKIPIGTVMSRLARCREALRKLVLMALKGETNG